MICHQEVLFVSFGLFNQCERPNNKSFQSTRILQHVLVVSVWVFDGFLEMRRLFSKNLHLGGYEQTSKVDFSLKVFLFWWKVHNIPHQYIFERQDKVSTISYNFELFTCNPSKFSLETFWTLLLFQVNQDQSSKIQDHNKNADERRAHNGGRKG